MLCVGIVQKAESPKQIIYTSSSQPFQHQGPVVLSWKPFMEDNFSTGQGRDGDGLGMIQAYYMYCGCYFYYLLLSFTSDHQALDPRG